METHPLYKGARGLLEISTVITKHRETADEELHLIDMRYQQALSLLSLECLFAEGLLNCGETPTPGHAIGCACSDDR